MRILEVTPQSGGMLHVLTDDGRRGVMNVGAYFDAEAFSPLRNPEEFIKIRNMGYFVEWECGADLSADTIEARMIPLSCTQPPAMAH